MAAMLTTPWRLLPQRYFGANIVGAAVYAPPGKILCFGHSSVNGMNNRTCYIAKCFPDGELLAFKGTGALAASRSSTTGMIYGDTVYSFGGLSAPFDVVSAKLSDMDLAAFTQVMSLDSGAIFLSSSCVDPSSGLVFFGGGSKSGTFQTKSYIFSPASQTILGTFDLPVAMGSFRSAIVDGYLYIFGGSNATVGFDTVWSTKIQGNTGIGQWKIAGYLPQAMCRFSLVQKDDRILIAGGSPGIAASGLTGVYSFQLAGGTFASATSIESPLPVGLYFSGMVTDGSNVWVIGGQTGSNVTTQSVSTIYHAKIA